MRILDLSRHKQPHQSQSWFTSTVFSPSCLTCEVWYGVSIAGDIVKNIFFKKAWIFSLLFLGPEIYGLHEILEEPVKILSFFVSLAKDYCSSIFLPQPGLVIIFQRQFIQEIYIPDRLTPFSSWTASQEVFDLLGFISVLVKYHG